MEIQNAKKNELITVFSSTTDTRSSKSAKYLKLCTYLVAAQTCKYVYNNEPKIYIYRYVHHIKK